VISAVSTASQPATKAIIDMHPVTVLCVAEAGR